MMKILNRRSPILLRFCTLAMAFAALLLTAAEPPALIPFQGHLARPSVQDSQRFEAVPNGQYDVLFTLYAAPVGGESKVWGPERHATLTVINGLVNAMLGSVIGFQDALAVDPNFFNRPLYVGITVDADGNPATADLELVPRQVLLPAVQAHNANRLDGADWRDFFVGTDGQGAFINGTTKARDAEKLDGFDWNDFFNNGDPSTGTIAGGRLTPGTVTGEQLASGVLDGSHLADGSVTGADIEDGGVNTVDLADGAVTAAKVEADSILAAPHYFTVANYVRLWSSYSGEQVLDLVDRVPVQARGAILKVIVNGGTAGSGSAFFADANGEFHTSLIHYFQNGVTAYTDWAGGTVFVPFHDGKKIRIRTASNANGGLGVDSRVNCFGTLIGWF